MTSTDNTLRGDAASTPDQRPIAIWLLAVAALVTIMVVVGGLTRLTESGLSITEWKPVTGAIPPLSADVWQQEFDKYRQIPQYQLVNKGMSLDEFKVIYWWEWAHRFLGRLIGLAFFVPFVWFLATGRLRGRLAWTCAGLFVLGGLQGFMGWYMVASGLTERVSVSQYRLAAHLGLAFIIFAALLWVALGILRQAAGAGERRWILWTGGLAALVYVQIVLGAFVAGLDAGMIYNTWPLMDGAFIPDRVYGVPLAAFEDHMTVQFNHRMVAYLIAIATVVFCWRVVAGGAPRDLRKAAMWFATAVVAQILFGIWTLLAVVPIWMGGVHQFGAVVVLGAAIYLLHIAVHGGNRAAVPA
ncbi:COX15/CtaA family protein [Pyruvatibacter sp.]|uniref:COX15/CtaA family protein n=1 Tax=Pyruvatibacter sp. TaxID=1981328 RepID=UPI0032EBF3FC